MAEPARNPQPSLLRELGVSHAIAIVVGTIIGSGIFRVPGLMVSELGSAKLVYLVWIVGGVLSFFGALTYAELGALMPEAGGEYIYIRDGYGPLAGFLYAWTWFIIAKPASVASVTTGLADALSALPHFGGLQHALITRPFPVTGGQLVAIAATILISFLNYIGVRRAGSFQLVFTVMKVAMLVAIAVLGFAYAGGSWTHFSGAAPHPFKMTAFMAALVAALWAYDGWNDLNMVAGEVKRPERSLPIALIAGVAIVGGLYMLMYGAIQYVLPMGAVAGAKNPASDMMQLIFGAKGAFIITAGIALSMLVTLNGTIMSGGRIPYAVARDRYFFQKLAEVHPRFRTPANALLVQAVLSIVLLLLSNSFKELLSLAIFAEWLFYAVATSTVFVFRRRVPASQRPYTAPGYPVVPALFVIAAVVLLYYTFMDNVRDSAWGLVVIAAGIPVYLWFAAKKRAVTS